MYIACTADGTVLAAAAEFSESKYGVYTFNDVCVQKWLLSEIKEVVELPEDFEPNKYMHVDGAFVRHPDWPADPEPTPTTEERLAALERENKALQSQLAASIQSNQMLEDCLVEMAGIVYA